MPPSLNFFPNLITARSFYLLNIWQFIVIILMALALALIGAVPIFGFLNVEAYAISIFLSTLSPGLLLGVIGSLFISSSKLFLILSVLGNIFIYYFIILNYRKLKLWALSEQDTKKVFLPFIMWPLTLWTLLLLLAYLRGEI